MNLINLCSPILNKRIVGNIDLNINGIEVDSRKVKSGNLFICLPGFTVDGHDYANKAVENGAVALVCQRELPIAVPQIIVTDSRFAMSVMSDIFYEQPSHKLRVIGVTGTNGKTTTTHLIEKILADQGYLSGLIGTIKTKIGTEVFENKNTTPDSIELQKSFAKMVDVGSDYVIMEVSSHALDLGRVKGVDYNIAVFTNLTQDHLDYHHTMDQYRNAKGLFFSQLGNSYEKERKENKYAILNGDDVASEYYKRVTASQVITYGIDNEADVNGTDIVISANGTSFTLSSFMGSIKINLKMIGKFSVYNALAAATVAIVEGVSLESIKKSLESIDGVDGRFEAVNEGQEFTVIVDYAHTPDSLENVLKTVKEFAQGKVFCIFGAGGDRDRTKRPIMGQIATKYSDFTIITSDNPRSEDPDMIIADILEGVKKISVNNSYIAITDRKSAIEYAIANAKAQDVILIAGKGHETYQIIGTEVIHFDDREIARAAIRGKLT